MKFGNHIADIFRQLWASLTGGWYYEPANSIFCNTLHFYVWCLLVVLPLILSIIFANNGFSVKIVFAYIAFIFILFGSLKLIVGYLHGIFDSEEPIIKYKTKNASISGTTGGPMECYRSPMSSFSARATETNVIELVDLGADREHNDAPQNTNENGDEDEEAKNGDSEKTTVRSTTVFKDDDKIYSLFDDVSSSSSSGKNSTNELLTGEPRRRSAAVGRRESRGILLPADSLELLTSNREGSLSRRLSYAARRKHSEPSANSASVFRFNVQGNGGDEKPFVIRKVHSSSETRINRIHNGSSFFGASMARRSLRARRHRGAFTKNGRTELFVDELEAARANSIENWLRARAKNSHERNVIVDDRHPCSFKSLKSQSPATAQPTLPAPESSEDSSADEHFPPDRLAKRSLDEPVSDLHKTLDRLSGTNDLQQSAGDLKGEITKFLEDLIEKHPETLDAIESVRMNRMGRISEKNALPSTDPIPQLSRAILRNNNLTTPNSTTHVAYNHEDTTPGAVHSFQDEQGNWWTYAFDQESSGVAHALGSSRAISAIFNKRRRQSDDEDKADEKRYNSDRISAESNVGSVEPDGEAKTYIDYDDNGEDDNEVPEERKEKVESSKSYSGPMVSKIGSRRSHSPGQQPERVIELDVGHCRRHRYRRNVKECTSSANVSQLSSQRPSRYVKHGMSSTNPTLTLDEPTASTSLGLMKRVNSEDSYTSSTSSNSLASDDVELAKYIPNAPTNILYPVSNVVSLDPGESAHEMSTAPVSHSGLSQQHYHRRHRSDSGGSCFVSFLNMTSRFYNPSAAAASTSSHADRRTRQALNTPANTPSTSQMRLMSDMQRIIGSTHNNPDSSAPNVSALCAADGSFSPNTRILTPSSSSRIHRISLQPVSSHFSSHVEGEPLSSTSSSHHHRHTHRHHQHRGSSGIGLVATASGAVRTIVDDTLNTRRELSSDDGAETLMMNDMSIPGRSGMLSARNPQSMNSVNMRILSDLQSLGFSRSCLRNIGASSNQNRMKANYYYKLKLLPKFFSGRDFKIKINRLSLGALFDRNHSLLSGVIDVFFSVLVACLAALMISFNVYSDFSLLIFCFVVAGSQFSLLKSVQPDAASPVHGFNWLIAYSRPVYFCILSFFYLMIELYTGGDISLRHTTNNEMGDASAAKNMNDIYWYWSPSWVHLYSNHGFFFSVKDIVATSILFLPIIFTFGLLPQIDTLFMHVIEQIDVNLFGGTAAFSLGSAMLSLSRSVGCVGMLTVFSYLSYQIDYGDSLSSSAAAPTSSVSSSFDYSMQNPLFSFFVAFTISTAYVTSRWSSNPLILRFLLHYCRLLPSAEESRIQVETDDNLDEVSSSESTALNFGVPFFKSFCCARKLAVEKPTPENLQGRQPTCQASDVEFADVSFPSAGVSTPLRHSMQPSKPLKGMDDCGGEKEVFSILNRSNVQNISQEKLRRLSKSSVNSANASNGNESHRSSNCPELLETFCNISEDLPAAGTAFASTQEPSRTGENRHSKNHWKSVQQFNRDHSVLLNLKKDESNRENPIDSVNIDTLPKAIRNTLTERLRHDLFYLMVNSCVLFGVHSSSLFTVLQPQIEIVLCTFCVVLGGLNHYVYPQLRSHTPWKLFAAPILKSHEFHQFETTVEAKLMVFERVHVIMVFVEKIILYPLLVMSLMSTAAWRLPFWNVPLLALCGFRVARSCFGQSQLAFIPLAFAFLLNISGLIGNISADKGSSSDGAYLPTLLLFYILLAIWPKVEEFILKLNFIFVYIAPWQISWGSAFHAFAQPFSVPHTGLICAQAIISSIVSAPLNPFLGSSFFLMSYVRPVKFWEKDYNTKRVDHSNLRLISQLDRGPMLDDSNLNAIFYEHLTRSLQKSLAGDLLLGRWATSVRQGDCFILASLYLNCLVHIIEVGNDFITFQVRGLEFRGTYCHQREVEAISEDWTDGGGCCCCTLGKLSMFISFNSAWSLRWLAWEVVVGKYVIDGYSITDNSAVNLLQMHDLRRLLVSLYVKCIIFYATNSPNFKKWLTNETILRAMEPILKNTRFVDSDQMFCAANDEDFDINLSGISKQCFVDFYGDWINHCYKKREQKFGYGRSGSDPTSSSRVKEDLNLVTCFSFALSILGRRVLGAAAFNRHANAAESFLFGLHALFKGDIRITSSADEWVFTDPEILTLVISPAVRMSLKLHQDHFAAVDDFEENNMLYERIEQYQSRIFISHEHDPAWREAIISNTPSLLALRHMFDDGQDDYKIIMLNKMHLNMRVIKLNRECVRAFWAGQQQELIFLRNRNPERGSIQNARQVLRNMINSSADQPIGYPIYVSPLVTSFVETHQQIGTTAASSLNFCRIWAWLQHTIAQIWSHFGTSGSSNLPPQDQFPMTTIRSSAPTIAPQVPATSTGGGIKAGSSADTTKTSAVPPPAPTLISAPSEANSGNVDGGADGLVIENKDAWIAEPIGSINDNIRRSGSLGHTSVGAVSSVLPTIGPSISQAGSTPAPHRKHNGSGNLSSGSVGRNSTSTKLSTTMKRNSLTIDRESE